MLIQLSITKNLIIVLLSALIMHSFCYSQTVETLTSPFSAAGGVNVDKDGTVYVADFGDFLNSGNGTTVYKVFEDGTVELFATGLIGASGNDFGPDGYLYQSNIGGNRISKIAIDGTVTTFANGVTNPVGCVVTKDTIVFATNCIQNPGEIDMITPDGTVTTFVSSNLLSCPNGLTMDSLGNLYACNFNNGWVIKITPDKQVSNFAFIPGNNNGHLTFANGVLYVVARCANQIYKVELDGTVSLLAGTGVRGNQDGSALNATFSIPNGIAASLTGDTLYINDATSLTGGCFNGSLNPIIVRMITGVNNPTSVGEDINKIPEEFQLEQNYPNPFNPSTKIRFSVAAESQVVLKVYNLLGKEVATLMNEKKTPGFYELNFGGEKLPSGIYVYRLEAGSFSSSKKMILLK
jgi:sugar lactone lactonase YvrE